MTREVYLVGCGASKLDREAPARELYTETEQPLAGLQLGERLRWFKERRAAA